MKRILYSREMYNADKSASSDFFMPSSVLMERAALGIIALLVKEDLIGLKTLILCGNGNNGGDAVAVGRIMKEKGYDPDLYFPMGNKDMGGDLKAELKTANAHGVNILREFPELKDYKVVVDGIFGIGLSRDIEGNLSEIIERVNEAPLIRVAIDIPSGLSADKGNIMGCCFKADYTVTFGFPKVGQLLPEGRANCGRLIVEDIGITEKCLSGSQDNIYSPEPSDLSLIPKRKEDSHKGTYGKVLVIAGSPGMAGAAYLSAAAAYRTGAGMVKIYSPEENRVILQELLPEGILTVYDKKWDEKSLINDMKWADAILCGPGIGVSSSSKSMVDYVLKNAAVPVVFDADALNIISENPDILLRPHTDMVITPHLMEMSRLTGESISYLKSEIISVSKEFARDHQVICVLKDSVTVTAVPFENTYINTSGNNGMATAGAGDVLSGIIAGLIATGLKPDTAAPLGVYIHGLAGDHARDCINPYSMTSRDILDNIYRVFL